MKPTATIILWRMHTNLSFVVDGRQTTGVRTLAEMTGWSVLELVGLQPLANGFMKLLPVHICWIGWQSSWQPAYHLVLAHGFARTHLLMGTAVL